MNTEQYIKETIKLLESLLNIEEARTKMKEIDEQIWRAYHE